MEKDSTKLLAIILAVLAILVIIISFITKQDKKTTPEILILKQPSEFFTVNSCLYRTMTFVSKKDTDSVLKILDKKYKKENKINAENVLNLFPKTEGEITFVSKKMFYEKLSKSMKKYYVKGMIKANTIHDYVEVEKEPENYLYFIVIMDSKNQTFSVEPYDGAIFVDGDSNE